MAAANPQMKLDPKYDDYDYPVTAPENKSGHPGHTTPEQDAQVFQLRTMLEAEGYKERLDTLTLVGDVRSRKCLADAIPVAIFESTQVRRQPRKRDVRIQ